MQIDPSKLPGRRLYRDARADLVPNTPLMDMQVNIFPGSASAGPLPHGGPSRWRRRPHPSIPMSS